MEEPMSKKERRETARQERDQLRQQADRRRRWRRAAGTVAVVVSAILIVLAILAVTRESGTTTGEHILVGPAPWPANPEDLAARLSESDLPALTAMEQLDYHIHAHLDMFVDGEPVVVPTNIGIDPSVGIAVLHTHDERGVIHIEAPEPRDFTLSEFFDVWGIRLTDSCIGGYCGDGVTSLQVFVNGEEVTGVPGDIVLEAHDAIVLAFGTSDQLPDPIPSSFEFQPGE